MKNIYFLLGGILAVGSSFGQINPGMNPQYKFTSEAKHAPNALSWFDNRAAVHADEDRATYYSENFDDGSMGGWTNTVEVGGVGFESTNVGHANDAGSTFVIPALNTSTPTYWILLDSDSDGTLGAEEMATLTSPTIDLTAGGLTGSAPYPLKLEMEQFYAGWQSDTIFLEVSDDNGSTWDQIEIANNDVGREGRPNPELVSINITPYIIDPTQVKLRFRWHGNWDYGWQFDNVTISDLPMHDITVSKLFRGDWINGYSYSKVPDEQVAELIIGADLANIGFEDITNIAFDWEILDPSMAVAASGTSTALASLSNGENDTIWVSTGFTASALGNYTINITAVSDSTEDAADLVNNDAVDAYYEVTDWTYGCDYGTLGSPFYGWASSPDGAASIGSIFSIEADGVIGGIEAELDDFEDVVDQLIYYAIYKWNGTEFEWQDQTDDYTTTAADQGEIVTLYFDSPFSVAAGDFVVAVAGHYGGSNSAGFEMRGGVPFGQTVGFDDGTTAGMITLLDPSGPVVRMLMHDFTGVEETVATEEFKFYPNPANDQLNVTLTMVNAENAVINIRDISGKTVMSQNLGSINGTRNLIIDVDHLNSGAYFIEVADQDGKEVKKFIKK